MKLKEIKPGMVIHCKTENEANRLLCELVYLGYRWWNGRSICELHFEDSVNGCGYWIKDNKTVDWGRIGYYKERTAEYGEIIPFSSLVIPEKAYEDGLNEAWAAAKKIVLRKEHGGLPCEDLERIFEREPEWEVEYSIFKNLTPQEAISKLEAYEAEKQIKVGDVVMESSNRGVVTRIDGERFYITWCDGSSGRNSATGLKKTGKHIDISSILAEIGKE